MLPRLVELELHDAGIQGVHLRLQAKQIGRLIDHHAPMLEDLRFTVDHDEHPVMRAWRTLRGILQDEELWDQQDSFQI
jgi:hypothetical protein